MRELRLTCSKCLRTATFPARDQFAAATMAKQAGWVKRFDKMVCPKCPAVRE